MPSVIQLDLSLLDHYEAPGAFMQIDPNVTSSLQPLPEVLERIDGCVAFSYSMKRDFGDRLAPTSLELSKSRKFLRAALAEFASMEDAAILDFDALGRGPPPLMRSLTDPRIHVVRLLRHANVHLSATSLSHSHRDAVWRTPEGDHEFSYLLLLAENLQVSISQTREAARYDAHDLAVMIDWLDQEQREWGIGHVVLRTAELYGRFLANAL